MIKKEYKPKVYPIPLPVVLLGANIKGKANFNVIAYSGIISRNPAVIYVSSQETNYTNEGIHENKTFSANIPSADMVKKVDYCGIVSGKNVDKSEIFEVFYGELDTAPMIKECPLNMECKVINQLKISKMEVFVGEIVQSYIGEDYITEGKPNIKKINPLIYSLERRYYFDLGNIIADGLSIGKEYKNLTSEE